MLSTKKFIQKAACIATAAVCATIYATSTIPASAYYNGYCSTKGFEVDEDYYKDIGHCSYLNQTVYWGNQVLGTTCTTMIFATQRDQFIANGNRYNMNVAMYHTAVSPKTLSGGYVGYSERLEYKTTLPKWFHSIEGSQPVMMADSNSYTVGFSTEEGLSGSVEGTQNRLRIQNYTDRSQRLYRVVYDYQPYWLWSSGSNDYLRCESEQKGTLYYKTDGQVFLFPLTVSVDFGLYPVWTTKSSTASWNIQIC